MPQGDRASPRLCEAHSSGRSWRATSISWNRGSLPVLTIKVLAKEVLLAKEGGVMSLSVRCNAVRAGLVLVGMVGCGQAPQPSAPAKKPPSEASQQWANVSNGFIEDYLRAQPFFAALAGRHEFDGQLPDLSSHGIKREIARLHDARTQIGAVDPAPLEPRERFDREYLLSIVDKNLFWLEKARFPFTNPYWYLANLDPDLYVTRNYAPAEVRMKAYIKYARGVPKMVTDIQANLQAPPPKTS